MKESIFNYIEQLKRNKEKKRKMTTVLCALSLIVAIGVFWQLRIVGVTMADEACCGIPEHVHTEECITGKRLICGYDEEGYPIDDQSSESQVCTKEEHIHGEECYDEDGNLICDKEEHLHNENCVLAEEPKHVHTEECYEYVYGCGLEEHTHTLMCYSDPKADLETKDQWETTLPGNLSGDWSKDLATVALSQLNYPESDRNYVLAEDGVTKMGYTRYGEWYGNPYGQWDAMFASFCLNYAGVPENAVSRNSGSYPIKVSAQNAGIYHEAANYTPKAGDLAFIKGADGESVAIVSEVKADDKGNVLSVTVIQGDFENAVSKRLFFADDAKISGYGDITAAYEKETGVELRAENLESENVELLAASTNIKDYLGKHGGETDIKLFGKDGSILPTDPDTGAIIVQPGKIYQLQLDLIAPNGIQPGKYFYQLPKGPKYSASTPGEVNKFIVDGKEIGTWTMDANGKIEFDFNEEANKVSDVKIPVSAYVEFKEGSGNIDFDGIINVVITEKPPETKPFLNKNGNVVKQSNPKEVKWTSRINGNSIDKNGKVTNHDLIGKTIKDTLGDGSTYTKKNQDKGIIFTAIKTNEDGTVTKYEWTAKEPDVTWNDKTWEYKIPSEVTTNDGKKVKLTNDMDFSLEYRSTIDKDYNGKIYNTINVDGQKASRIVKYFGNTGAGKIIKDGRYDPVTDMFKFDIKATIPANPEGVKDTFGWLIRDVATITKAEGTQADKLGHFIDPNNLIMTMLVDGQKTQIPYCNNANGSEYCYAITISTSTTASSVANIWLMHKCECNKDNCEHLDKHGKCMLPSALTGAKLTPTGQKLPDGYCTCWPLKSEADIKISYDMPAQDIIKAHGGKARGFKNEAKLYNHVISPGNKVEEHFIHLDSVKIDIPGVFDKTLTEDPNKKNEYIATFTITVNEAKLDVAQANETLTIRDEMSPTLVYMSGSMNVVAEDENKIIRTLVEGKDYKLTQSKREDTQNPGKYYQILEIEILNPNTKILNEKYTLNYKAQIVTDQTSAQYSNNASITLWNKEYKDAIENNVTNITISGKLYKVQVTKHALVPDGEVLGGATFGLYDGTSGGRITGATTAPDGTCLFQTNVTEGIIFQGHKAYYLLEEKAPEGYIEDGKKHYFYFCADKKDEKNCQKCAEIKKQYPGIIRVPVLKTAENIDIVNKKGGPIMPNTGGRGILPYIIVGLTLMTAPIIYIRKKRKQKMGGI